MRKRRLSGQFSLRNFQQEHDRENMHSAGNTNRSETETEVWNKNFPRFVKTDRRSFKKIGWNHCRNDTV